MTYTLKSANFTAEVGKAYVVDTTSSVVSATLPASPAQGDVIFFADARGTWMTNAITVLRNGNKIEASNVNFSNNASGSFFSVVYIDSTTGWRILTSGTKPLNINPPAVSGVYDFTTTNGMWTGNPTTFTYQWQMSTNGTTGWADISGATSSTFLALQADEGKYVRVGVIATNSNGSSVIVYSAASSAINLPDFPTSGLLAFWKLDGVNDSSGNDNTLTNNNGVTFGVGKVGDAAEFDGGNSLSSPVFVADSSTADWSISCWGFLENDVSQVLIGTPGYGGGFMLFGTGDGTIAFNNISGYGPLVSAAISTGQWIHIVAQVSAGMAKLYINGTLEDTATWNGSSNPPTCTFGSIGESNLTGKIDAVGFWNRALTSQEIAQLYNNGNGVEP
jgi:hypothetical protein